MTCPNCTGFTPVKIDERMTRGMVELCPKHALTEALAKGFRQTQQHSRCMCPDCEAARDLLASYDALEER